MVVFETKCISKQYDTTLIENTSILFSSAKTAHFGLTKFVCVCIQSSWGISHQLTGS